MTSSHRTKTPWWSPSWHAGCGPAGSRFAVKPGQSPILPVIIGDATLAVKLADALLTRGIYVIAFSYPVVPQGQARIRIQVSAGHTGEQLDKAAAAFAAAGRELHITK